MYLLVENNKYELPLMVADSISLLARMLNCKYETIYRIVRRGSASHLFFGISTRIYEVEEMDEED